MKQLAFIGAIALALALLVSGGQAQQQERHKHQVVVLWAAQNGGPVFINGQYHYAYDGARVYCSSSSSNAPVFPQQFGDYIGGGTQIADALAQLLDEGYRMVGQDANGLHFVMIR